jgi:hypothetical protein
MTLPCISYEDWEECVDMDVLRFEVIQSISGCEIGSDAMTIECVSGVMLRLMHEEDCCESVVIEDIVGDPKDCTGALITSAEIVGTVNDREDVVVHPESWPDKTVPLSEDNHESVTWTYYKINTTRGEINIRWCGSSNGYYSECVSVLWRGSRYDQ